MPVIRLFVLGMMFLFVTGCTQIVSESLHGQPPVMPLKMQPIKAVVLPFADYSAGAESMPAYSRNLAVMEAVTDELVARGFRLPVEEDVFRYLVDRDIIKIVPYGRDPDLSTTKGLEKEMKGNWSESMKKELSMLITQEKKNVATAANEDANPLSKPGTHGLDQQEIAQIGRIFGAEYVVRGRIIEYKLRKENTWDPTKRGILPVFYGATSRMMFGVAKSDNYDNLGSMVSGGVLGAIIGHNATAPFAPPDKITTSTTSTTSSGYPLDPDVTTTTNRATELVGGTDDYALYNSLAWGALGAGTAFLAQKGGDVPQAVVQLRIWVQESATGEVVWTNRAEVMVSPESLFADNQRDSLFKTAVDRSVAALVDDFVARTEL